MSVKDADIGQEKRTSSDGGLILLVCRYNICWQGNRDALFEVLTVDFSLTKMRS